MPGAEDSVILKLKVELEESDKAFKDYKTRLNQLKREKTKDNKAERVDLQRRANEEAKLHRTKLNQIKEIRAARRIENSVWLKDLSKIPEQLGQKYQAWARRNPEAAAMFRGVRTAGKLFTRPAMAAARLGVGAAASTVSGLLGMLIGGIQQGYQTHLQVGQAMGSITGMGATKGGMGPKIGKGIGMGFRPSETWQQAAQVGRAVGSPTAVTLAQQLALGGGGMGVGEAAGIMGQLRQAGVEFNAPNRPQASQLLGKLIEKGLLTGLEKARLPEYLHGVSTMAEMVGGRQAGKVDVDTIATTLSYLGRIPGMQGQRGVNLMQTIDQAIKSPGGGEAGQQLMLQAMGFGKPGGETPYYEAVKRQQRGITGVGGAQNLIDVFKEIQSQYGPMGKGSQSQEANLAAQTAMPGLTLDMIESIGDMINSGKSQEEILKGIEDQTKKFKPVEERVVDAIKEGFQGVRIRLAGQEAKSAATGAKFAKVVETLQDEMHKLLMELIKAIKPHLPEIIEAIKLMGGFAREALKRMGKTAGELAEYGVGAAKAWQGKTPVGKALGGGLTGALGEIAVRYYGKQAAEKDVEQLKSMASQYPGVPPGRLKRLAKMREAAGEPTEYMPGYMAPGGEKTQGLSAAQIALRAYTRKVLAQPITKQEQQETERLQKAFDKIQEEKAEKEKETLKQMKKDTEAYQKRTKGGEEGASLNPETFADPFAPGQKLAQTGPAGVRMVEGRVLMPVPYHPGATYKGAPGSGKGETVG